MIKSKTKMLAERAGFVLWADEEHKPSDAEIDWASNYDKELETFLHLVVKECALLQMLRSVQRHGYDKYDDVKAILDHFGIDEEDL